MAVTQRPSRTPRSLPKYKAPWGGKYQIWITKSQLERYNKALAAKNAEIKTEQKIIDKAAKKILELEAVKSGAWNDYQFSHSPAAYALYLQKVSEITAQKTIQKNAEDKIKAIKKAVNANFLNEYLQGTKPGSTSAGVKTTDATLKPPFEYKYNAPMVKNAYMPFGPQVDSAKNPSLISSPGNFLNAANEAWKTSNENGIAGAKGVIQMSSFLAQHTTITEESRKQAFFDENMYGFKFLYNPNSVSMTWGINTEVNTQMESMGLDKSVPLTAGLFNSTISFELLLNRIEDMTFLESSGIPSNIITRTNGTNYITQNVPTKNVEDIYPSYVSNDDLKLIYKKGTMYDIEYLFKAVNGFNSQYNSSLNGLTADRGWLYALPVELHLGDGMHYLVRLTTLNVNHNMFNERMVPILSTVTLTCTRYYDGPEQTYGASTK